MIAGKKTSARSADPFSNIGGSAVLNFVNTRSMGANGLEERLQSYADLVAWAEFFEVITPAQARRLSGARSRAADAALADAREIREATRATFEATHRDAPIPHRIVKLLNSALEHQSGRFVLEPHRNRLDLHFAARIEAPKDLVAAIARNTAALLGGYELTRVRPCEGAKCVLWFIDRTRNGSRHWCRMDRCGARAKSAAYYKRTRARKV